MHLRYDCYDAPDAHPQAVMRKLGITYQHSTPQSIVDQWWFWNCKNIPTNLPSYLTELKIAPEDAVGRGLSKEDASTIRNGMDHPR